MELLTLARQLENRRKQLGMSCANVAIRSGLGLRTVQRVLSEESAPEWSTLEKIASVLGAAIALTLKETDVEKLREKQADDKASRLVALTQGTSALEAQAVSEATLKQLRKHTARELLCGSTRRLWAD